jgi:hypothetical protein
MTEARMISLFTLLGPAPRTRVCPGLRLSRGDCGWSVGSGGEYSDGTAKQDPVS